MTRSRQSLKLGLLMLSSVLFWNDQAQSHDSTPSTPSQKANSSDRIHFKDGKMLTGKVIELHDHFMTFQEAIPSGHFTRKWEMKLIQKIEFFIPIDLQNVLNDKNWKQHSLTLYQTFIRESRHLHRAEHYVGLVGLAYAEGALQEGEQKDYQHALEICNQIEKHDWNPQRVQKSAQLKLHLLLALGNVDEARKLASDIESRSGNSSMKITAELVITHSKRIHLEKLIQEHPKWEEDDAVYDDVMRLFTEILDAYLNPSLFHGAEEEIAAEGLYHAHLLSETLGQRESSESALLDLFHLYPETSWAQKLRPKVSKTRLKSNIEEIQDDRDPDQDEVETEALKTNKSVISKPDELKRMLERADEDQLKVYRLKQSAP